jgi:hypothetical protein
VLVSLLDAPKSSCRDLTYRAILALALGALQRYEEAESLFGRSREIGVQLCRPGHDGSGATGRRDDVHDGTVLSTRCRSLCRRLTRTGNRQRGQEIARLLGPREKKGTLIGWFCSMLPVVIFGPLASGSHTN